MHVTYGVLLEVNVALSRGLLGKHPYTGEVNEPIKELPVGIFRHLRRLHKAVKDELEIGATDHQEFIRKWAVNGKFPNKDSENWVEFAPAYNEFFGTPDIILPFAVPFELDLIDKKMAVPTYIMNLMEDVNDAIAEEMKEKEIPPATAVNDNGAETPNANAS